MKIIILLLVIFLTACADREKPISEKIQAINNLNGIWLLECATSNLAGTGLDIPTRYSTSWEERYSNSSNFEFIGTIYNSPLCSNQVVSRIKYSGTYLFGEPINATFSRGPGKTVTAWNIEYTIENTEIIGNKQLANIVFDIFESNTLYDIVYTEKNIKYSSWNLSNTIYVSPILTSEYDRTNEFINRPVIPAIPYNTQLSETDLISTWYNGCSKRIFSTNPTLEERISSIITFNSDNTIEIEYSRWMGSNCNPFTDTLVSTISFSGTYSVIDSVLTSVANVPAAIIDLTIDPEYILSGDQTDNTLISLFAKDAGSIFYLLVFYDSALNMLFYGGWGETDITKVPTYLEKGLQKYQVRID